MFFTNPRLEKLVDDIFENNSSRFSPMFNSTIVKRYYDLPTVSRDEDSIEIKLTLPGYEKEDLEISTNENELLIKTTENLSDSLESFDRNFELMEDADISTAHAEMKAGILTVSFNYKKAKKAKKIKIN